MNSEIIKQGIGVKSIIKDYAKLRDWELNILIEKGYEDAVTEKKRRDLLSPHNKPHSVKDFVQKMQVTQ